MKKPVSYELPFNVKLGPNACSFFCQDTKVTLHGDQVVTLTELSPHIRQWLQAGGLVATDEEATVGVKKAAKPKAAKEAKDKDKGKTEDKGAGKKDGDEEDEEDIDKMLDDKK